jgi:hypothetical protein
MNLGFRHVFTATAGCVFVASRELHAHVLMLLTMMYDLWDPRSDPKPVPTIRSEILLPI